MTKTREDGWQLLTEFVQSDSLRRHCLAVETAMRAYARHFGESEEEWGLVGLIHDYDYEIHPTLDQHPQAGIPLLRERGYPEWAIRAIESHADHLDVPRETRLEQTLYAVDELTGFIAAVALVRPSRAVAEVTPQAVRKKMKDKAFARAVDRVAMTAGSEELGVAFDDHVAFVAAAMTANAAALGLEGTPGNVG
ncbi:MAG: HDIG domain protein [uncultured Thermomicrobiales bacterium]|uniref:HDIG domain protein n=1 Tax=uncultured Thermomicrobiales bacterium TaxID=1645740 RepID=A0A6J4UGN2_9BACT|nr:MAG: HDIG domain protein [uncultured Thermomicrobiales bacterium]